jgi:hypothetical protein
MSVRQTALLLALSFAGLSAAHAQSTFVGGEIGFIDRSVQSTLKREAVRQEFLAFRSNPLAPDGGQYVGGEAGYIFPQHTYARVNGEWVCTDKIAHNSKPDALRTPAEQSLFQQLYPA